MYEPVYIIRYRQHTIPVENMTQKWIKK